VNDEPEELEPQEIQPEPLENEPSLTVGRGVVAEVGRLAALEVPAVLRVGRSGPPWRVALAGSPIRIRIRSGEVTIRLWIVARPGADLVHTAAAVRTAVGTAVERLLGLRVAGVTVVVDGVGT
jgi:uncharacterized alkaline shock family protein YloU